MHAICRPPNKGDYFWPHNLITRFYLIPCAAFFHRLYRPVSNFFSSLRFCGQAAALGGNGPYMVLLQDNTYRAGRTRHVRSWAAMLPCDWPAVSVCIHAANKNKCKPAVSIVLVQFVRLYIVSPDEHPDILQARCLVTLQQCGSSEWH